MYGKKLSFNLVQSNFLFLQYIVGIYACGEFKHVSVFAACFILTELAK